MEHLSEVMKIIEGAVNADSKKVAAYTELLAKKLEEDGDGRAAQGLRKIVAKAKTAELSPSRVGAITRVPVDSEAGIALADQELIQPEETEVFLAPEAQESLGEFLRFVRESDRLLRAGVGISPSLLLYGPPGCGKTEVGKKVAAEVGLPLVTARTDALISSFLGKTAKNLRSLFDHAMGRPCVLFLDEFDALAKLRDDQHELGELKRVVVSLLQNIDALDNRTILLAATNHPHLLDPAIWRRFAFKVEVGLPEEEAREGMLRRFLGDFGAEKTVDILIQATEGMTGSEVRQVCEDAKRDAVLEDRTQVKVADVLRRIVRARLRGKTESDAPLWKRMQMARELSPKAFTYRRLGEIFGVSLGQVSNLLKRGEADG